MNSAKLASRNSHRLSKRFCRRLPIIKRRSDRRNLVDRSITGSPRDHGRADPASPCFINSFVSGQAEKPPMNELFSGTVNSRVFRQFRCSVEGKCGSNQDCVKIWNPSFASLDQPRKSAHPQGGRSLSGEMMQTRREFIEHLLLAGATGVWGRLLGLRRAGAGCSSRRRVAPISTPSTS